MKTHLSPIRIFGHLLLAAAGLAAAVPTLASSMKYTATLVTDVRVGDRRYHNAAVTLTFVGDTKDIVPAVDAQGQQIASQHDFCNGTGYFFWLAKGSASFSVQSHGRTLSGHFEPGQIFVALDTCNGGIGFGSHTGPDGLEVAYPVSFTLGTAMAVALTSGLSSPANMSGSAWSCIGFPPRIAGDIGGNGCTPPDAYPLHTDVGDVFIFMPYTTLSTSDGLVVGNHTGTLNRGTFAITPAEQEEEEK